MDSTELYKKLKKVSIYIFSFFFWYLVIAFFLKSDYPIHNYTFNRKDAYEILRDGLTLSAYFLAPAVGLVLVSDWRAQHVELKIERLSEEIWALNRRIVRKLYELQPTLVTGRTTIYKAEKNNLKYDIDEVKVKIFTLGGHKNIGMESFVDIGILINNKMIEVVENFDSIVEKIDKSIKVKEKDSNEFKFYYCDLNEDAIFDLISQISELEESNSELLNIGFTKKINS
ncbi:hypothetical protein [Acinetobacter pittii]|uniref:hypothetical protein n=1 Tax=Acinetobacter pittii TaxID=48296 RepID=UPI0034CF6295